MWRPSRLGLAVLLGGCGTTATSGDDAGGLDVDAGPSVCALTVGAAPASVRLSGRFGSDAGIFTVTVDAYFPRGRAPFAPVFLARASQGGLVVTEGTFLSDGGTATIQLRDACGESVKGRFLGPTGGFVGQATTNLGSGDALRRVEGSIELCPAGPAASPAAKAPTTIGPLDDLVVQASVPIDAATLSAIATSPSRSVTSRAAGGSLVLAIPPRPFTATSVDLSGVLDVMGRPLGLGVVKIAALSADLLDGTFDTAPPSGATLGPFAVAGGKALLGTGRDGDYLAAVSLGAAPTKRLRLRHRFACAAGAEPSATAALVAETGTRLALTAACGEPATGTVDLPEGGRWALIVKGAQRSSSACSLPFDAAPAVYELDEVAFE